MFADLFKILTQTEAISASQLEAIGYEQADIAAKQINADTSGSDLPDAKRSAVFAAGQSTCEYLELRWTFPVFRVIDRLRTAPGDRQDGLEHIPQWRPSTSIVLLKTPSPTALLTSDRLRRMIELHLTADTRSTRLDIKTLVNRQAGLLNIEPLPRLTRQAAGVTYAVVIDAIPQLRPDLAQLKSMFNELPGLLQPKEVWAVDQFGLWSSSNRNELHEQLPAVGADQLLVVADFRSPSLSLQQALDRFTAYDKVHHLSVAAKAGMYLGSALPLVSDALAVNHLLSLLYPVHHFPRYLLRDLRLELQASSAAEIDFWKHNDVQPHNSVLYDNGSVVSSRRQHFDTLNAWLEDDNLRVSALISNILLRLTENVDQYHEAVLNFPPQALDESLIESAQLHFAGMAKALASESHDINLKYKLSAVILGVSDRLVVEPSGLLTDAIDAAQRFRVRVEGNIGVLTGKPQAWMEGVLQAASIVQAQDGMCMVRSSSKHKGKLADLEIKGDSVVLEKASGRQWLVADEVFSDRQFIIHSANEQLRCERNDSDRYHWAECLEQNTSGLTLKTSQGLHINYPSRATGQPHPQFDTSEAPAWLKHAELSVDGFGLSATLILFDTEQILRWIPPGRFMMGSPDDEEGRFDSETHHEVLLTKGYWLSYVPCTQNLWTAVMGNNPSRFKGIDLPVESVSWEMAKEFLDKLNSQYPDLNLCLPTEAQWEYACRAGAQTTYSYGPQADKSRMNFDDNENRTTQNLKYSPNQWGIYDMHGNVFEWCSDWYGEYEHNEFVVNPTGPADGGHRVLRGGSWIYNARFCRSACRDFIGPSGRFNGVGFRFAQVDQQTAAQRQLAEGQEEAEQARRSRISRAASDAMSKIGDFIKGG